MGKITLLAGERILLLRIRIFRKVRITHNPAFQALHTYGLIEQNYSNKRNQHGVRMLDGTASLSKDGKRWIAQNRKDMVCKVFTPFVLNIVASVIASVIVAYLTALITVKTMGG